MLRFEDGLGRFSISVSTSLVKSSHLALLKFHLFTNFVGTGIMELTGRMNDGLCWDLGKGLRMV